MKKNIANVVSLMLVLMFSGCKNEASIQNTDYNKIVDDFVNPKDDNTLWCYWYWIGDDISKEGITKDLQAMKEAGIGGALIGNINPEEKDGKVPVLSEEWWEHMVHAVNEGKRIGVDIGVFNCPGWSQSGGPWIKSEMAMRYMTYSEAKVRGGKEVKVNLKKPAVEFQDTYVLAFPSISLEQNNLNARNSNIEIKPAIAGEHNLIDNDTSTIVNFSKGVKEYQISIKSDNVITARSIQLKPGKDTFKVRCVVSTIENNVLKSVKSFVIDRSKLTPNVGPDKFAPILVALPETKSNYFSIKFEVLGNVFQSNTYPNQKIPTWSLSDIIISEATGLEDFANKTLGKMHPTPFPAWDSYIWGQQDKIKNPDLKIAPDQVIDLSDKLDNDGDLTWDAPEGNWTIQRYGMTPTGTKNAPSAPQGKGYEVDKANKELVQFHYDQFIGELLRRIPEESKSAFKYVIADSYEMGSQNWTDGYEEKFEQKYGYNPKKYLPVFSGRIVGSVEESERFLWDLRRSVADAVAYEYTGGLREASNKDNLQLWLENYGHWGFPSEFLMYGGQSDLVSGEFWNEGTLGDIECKAASSAAHIYGKPITSAEAFTAANRTYVRHPAMLKKRGDWSFTEGINHFVLHLYIHQPDDNRVPGVNAWFSTEFNRHNTWFKKGKAYFDYLRRSQHMLQQGNYAADVCYFIGENTPIMTGVRNPELPSGYSYDYINAEVILNRLSVKDGKFVLPDGMTYSLMVLPPFKTMRPELLKKIESLVAQGGKIFGSAPEKSPSLQNFPECDEIVKSLAEKMWGNTPDKIKSYGKGYIVDGLSLQEALEQLNIYKDVILNKEQPVLWTHRTLEDMEIYFISNQSEESIEINPSFRTTGLKPQLWNAVTGEIRPLVDFKEQNGRTQVPLKLEALQSWFVVFTNNESDGVTYSTNFPNKEVAKTLDGSWSVDFLNKNIGPQEPIVFEKLIDWTESSNPDIKYYSGTAIYSSSFTYDKKTGVKDVFIDLGEVGVMATVKINGINIGTTWIAPYSLKATEALKEGENTIEVEVVNVWRNRLTGDKDLPKDQQTTWLLVDKTKPEEVLVSSGLLGPVSVVSID